ncbi:MAG: nicotinate-nucleotide diphosphorylase [Verrucomicrobiota bacterium]
MRAATATALLHRLAWTDLDPAYLRQLVAMARDEDLAGLGLRVKPRRRGDRSTATLARTAFARNGRAVIVAREPLIACGLQLIPLILAAYGAGTTVRLHTSDGRTVPAGGVLATLTGDPYTLLAAERVILNFIQRLSGIAVHTARHVAALGPGRTRLLDTRKTTPGHRMLEKYAVACGGGWNHRLGLFDRVMLKDNHLAVLGFAPHGTSNLQLATSNVGKTSASLAIQNRYRGQRPTSANTKFQTLPARFSLRVPTAALAAAVAAARRGAPDLPVEVEVDALAQIPAVVAAGADVILLDNFTPAQIRRAVALIAGRAGTEASGGITLKTLPRYAGLGLDFVSTGALVHHCVWADIGLDWRT